MKQKVIHYYSSYCRVLNHIKPSISVYFSLSPIHTQCRGGEHRKGHRRHPLLTFLPLQQPALSVFRTWGRGKHWGRWSETDRKPVGIRPLHHDSAHLTDTRHIMLVHLTCPALNNHRESLTFVGRLGGYNVSVSVLQWSWSGVSTLSSERAWWRVAIGQQ